MQTSLIIKNNKYIENNLKHKLILHACDSEINKYHINQTVLETQEHFGLHPTTFNFTFFQAAIEAPSSPLLLFLQSSAF